MSSVARLLLVCIAAAAVPAYGQDRVPVPKFGQYVTDQAGVLSAERRRQLEVIGRDFEAQNASRVAALIVPSTLPETMEQFALRVAEEWKIDNGALLLIAMNERAVRIEVGVKRGITDAQAKVISADIVAPMFKSGAADDSVEMGLRTMMQMIEMGPRATISTFTASESGSPLEAGKAPGAKRAKALGVIVAVLALGAGLYGWWMWRRRAAIAGDGRATGTSSASGGASDRAGALTWPSASSLVIIAANLVPVWGVVVEEWAIFPLFVLFWFEHVILIVVDGLRVMFARPDAALSVFFTSFMDAMFTVAYGLGIVSMFAHGTYVREAFNLQVAVGLVGELDIWPQVAGLAAIHVFLLLKETVGRQHRTADIELLTLKPTLRFIAMHLTLFFGGLLAMRLGSPLWALLILVILKTAMELGMHLGVIRPVR